MINKIVAFLVVLHLFHAASAEPVVVHADRPVSRVNPLMFGANFLFWIEDDAALADGIIEQRLKEMPVRLLRYPGGTVADNFHWKDARLHNKACFPYEDGPAESDFDEFMAFARRVGAEPAVVVNTESWFLSGDVEGGAREAADWVRYCKTKGYKVRFWEIGNETYWHIAMSAREYAQLVNVYAKAMKAVDPSILVGANGHWDLESVGTKERVRPEKLDELLDERRNITSRAEYRAFEKRVKENSRRSVVSGEEKWWPILSETCGGNIDFLVVHWYFGPDKLAYMSDKISEVREYFEAKHPRKNLGMFMSEYNVYQGEEPSPERELALCESIGEMLEGGVDMAAFWPLRMGGDLTKKRALLSLGENTPQAHYAVLQLLAREVGGELLAVEHGGSRVFAVRQDGEIRIFVSGRQAVAGETLVMRLSGIVQKEAKLERYTRNGGNWVITADKAPVRNGVVELDLEPDSLMLLRIRP